MRSGLLKETQRRRGGYLVPNLLTTGNLFCGLYAILAVMNESFFSAAIAMLVALVFDMLDGKSARWMNSTSQFGVEYDSLADLVSFGVAPGLLLYVWALEPHGMAGVAVMFAFVACGALRLARFNVITATSESKYFTGLPIPAAASVVATLVIFDHRVVALASGVKPILILVLTLTLAFLMVSAIKYRSFKDLQFKRAQLFNYLVWAILGLMLVVAWPAGMLFFVCIAYALAGPIEQLFTVSAKVVRKRRSGSVEQPVPQSKE